MKVHVGPFSQATHGFIPGIGRIMTLLLIYSYFCSVLIVRNGLRVIRNVSLLTVVGEFILRAVDQFRQHWTAEN